MIVAALLLSLTTRHDVWGRARFTDDWFGVTGIEAVHRRGTVYVLSGDTPLGFMMPLFPDDARFMRIGGTFPLGVDDGLGARARRDDRGCAKIGVAVGGADAAR